MQFLYCISSPGWFDFCTAHGCCHSGLSLATRIDSLDFCPTAAGQGLAQIVWRPQLIAGDLLSNAGDFIVHSVLSPTLAVCACGMKDLA